MDIAVDSQRVAWWLLLGLAVALTALGVWDVVRALAG